MIYERFRRYSHLPHQVVNNDINCYDTKKSKTKRHLATRAREHFSGNSAIFEHMSSCSTCNHSTIENFHILSHGNNDFDIKVKEALYIKKQKPLLNKHLYQHGASFLLNVF